MLMATNLHPAQGQCPSDEPCRAPRLAVHRAGDPERARVEDFIHQVYARRFGANASAFAPVLVSLHDPVDGSIVAAAGYRRAQGATLFLERYLGQRRHRPGHRQRAAPSRGRAGHACPGAGPSRHQHPLNIQRMEPTMSSARHPVA